MFETSSPVLPLLPNPSLLAILLIVKIGSRPHFAFHYPPRPGEEMPHISIDFDDDHSGDESSTSSDDLSTSSAPADKEPNQGDSKNVDQDTSMDAVVDETGSASPEKTSGIGTHFKPRWDEIFGFDAMALEKLLCPAPSFHKRRFELSVDHLTFLGWPVFSKAGGDWRRKRKERAARSQSSRHDASIDTAQDDIYMAGKTSVQVADALGETSGHETGIEDQPSSRPDDGDDDEKTTLKDSPDQSSSSLEKPHKKTKDMVELSKTERLNMFHVVFVLNPPPLEYHLRIKDMYDNIVKKFSRALKWEQTRSNYVMKESLKIIAIKSKFNRSSSESAHLPTLYHQLLSQSTLAKALSTLFKSVSTSRIAHISLTPTFSLSLQIPLLASTSTLPTPTSPQTPGLWLTTAAPTSTDDDINSTPSQLASHFTLLLLSDLPSILADVAATASPLTTPLTHYLRASTPTKSFLQLSQSTGLSLPDIQFLASHLIYWRRARAIPPLHQRDTYIVSPNANMAKLSSSRSTYAKAFPSLPSLPKILSMLSSTPRPYSALIPSKAHKQAYLDILAWLLRHGWVTQLRTFAWIRVPPHIKASVPSSSTTTHPTTNNPLSFPASSSTTPTPSSPTSSTHTTIPLPGTPPSLIPHPALASSALPSHHLSAIATHIQQTQGRETQLAWEKCVKYFDGRHALEMIAGREGWKRKRVAELVAGWEEMGVLVRGRFW